VLTARRRPLPIYPSHRKFGFVLHICRPPGAKLGLFCMICLFAGWASPPDTFREWPRLGLFCGFSLRAGQIGFVSHVLLRGRAPAGTTASAYIPEVTQVWLRFAHLPSGRHPGGTRLGSFCTYCDKRHKKNASRESRKALPRKVRMSRMTLPAGRNTSCGWVAPSEGPAARLYIDALRRLYVAYKSTFGREICERGSSTEN
jgi:hypothetical protein